MFWITYCNQPPAPDTSSLIFSLSSALESPATSPVPSTAYTDTSVQRILNVNINIFNFNQQVSIVTCGLICCAHRSQEWQTVTIGFGRGGFVNLYNKKRQKVTFLWVHNWWLVLLLLACDILLQMCFWEPGMHHLCTLQFSVRTAPYFFRKPSPVCAFVICKSKSVPFPSFFWVVIAFFSSPNEM